MLGGFGSLASGSKPGSGASHPRASSGPYKQTASNTNAQIGAQDDGDDSDPDLPPGMRGAIDKETYLRMRAEQIAALRGIDLEHPENNDPGARGRAIQQMEQQESNLSGQNTFLGRLAAVFGVSSAVGGTWTALGPAPIPNGQTTTVRTAVSGRVTAIAVHPTNPDIVYVGTAQGGVYRTINHGLAWTAIFDSANTLAIGAVTIDPNDTTRVWVGTGEGNFSGDSFFGVGVYLITNADTSPILNGPFNRDGSSIDVFTYRSVNTILVAPNNSNIVFVGTSSGASGLSGDVGPTLPARGLYRTTNALSATPTFTHLTTTAAINPAATNIAVQDMVFDPSDSTGETMLVGHRDTLGQSTGGAYRSINATDPTPSFTRTLTLTGSESIKFAINHVGSTVNVLAATGESSSGSSCSVASQSGALHRSTDGGVTWSSAIPSAGGFCKDQCGYDIAVALDLTDANIIYLGGASNSTCSGVLKKTSDGGLTFPRSDTGLHADTHVIVVAPSNPTIVYTGSDGGVWRSIDKGASWTSLNTAGFNATQFESIAVHPIDRNYTIGGTQDNGTEFLAPDGTTWIHSDDGDGGYALIDQSSPDTINVTAYHTYFNLSGSQIGFERATSTVSPGDPFWNIHLGCGGTSNGISCSDAVNFYAPMALGPGGSGNPNTVYFGSDRLYRSSDKGTTMSVVSQGPLVNTVPISAIAISPQDDNYRLVGLNSGALWFTTTGSSTLTQIGSGTIPAGRYISRIVFDPTNKNTAYIAFDAYMGSISAANSHVWRVTNLNTTPSFAAINGSGITGLPDVPVNAFAVDPVTTNNLFAGTDIGVFNSTDGGANWEPYGTGLPRVAVFDMAIQGPNRVLRIATHGRGMWEISIVATPPPTVRLTASDFPVSENVAAGFVTVSVIREGDATSAASVNYATSDTAGLTVCSQGGTGKASERCDYATSLGTLSWAAGEAGTKTFNIPIINDAIVEGNETFNVTLSSPTGVSLGTPSTATVTILDDDVAPSTNPIDGVDFFITQQYIDFLGRMPDQGGFTNWHNTLAPCPNGGFGEFDNPNCDRLHVAAGFLQSAEFLDRGYFAFRFYMVAYHQPPTYAQFIPDMAQVGGSKTPAEEEAAKVAFANAFVLQSSFTTKYPSLSGQALAEGLLQTAGLPAGSYNAGAQTNGQILRGIAQSQAALDKFLTEGTVSIQYFAFLRRDPDTIGYQNNVATLNLNPSNLRHMIFIFIYSSEYRGRFGTP